MGLSIDAWALGLGRMNVQSALGETLRAEIDVTSLTAEEASNLRVRVAPPESYRAAGVDYNQVLPGTQAVLQRRADGRPFLRLSSDRAVQEPFVDVILEISWSTGRLVREYTLLFDPPNNRNLAGAPASAPSPIQTAPSISQAPVELAEPPPARRAGASRPAPAPVPVAEAPELAQAPAQRDARRAPRPEAAASALAYAAARASSATAEGAQQGDDYRVRSGDTLSRIAGRTQRPGVSLDQMLVALYQANPQAFIGENMNRLRSGAVLSVPSAEAAQAVSANEARQLIQAQSADFGAYRQRLASTVPAARTDAPSRQAAGTVQSNVEDRKQAAAPAPDKLTLSKGSARASSEASISKEAEAKSAQTRVAELSKNVEELRRLSSAASSASTATPPPAASAPAVPGPTVVAAPPPVVAPAPALVPATAPASAPTPAAAPAASMPASVADPAPVLAAPPVAAPAASESASAVVESSAAPSGFLEENPLALALGGGLLALLAGFGIYRYTKRSKKDSGETSFLESRLQPDSFFGASGGQRIDTRDAGGTSSSMSYSLSQLDAIGDVDPVAEADVYLAYGRDLQAEEILKEAMRATPDRLAIRTKLLEVYAKRRDTKGFELLATQLYGLTNGQGEEWEKAQEIGQQIDPENQLYRPGGTPISTAGDGGRPSELLGASTMPQSVLPSTPEFGSTNSASAFDSPSGGTVDLDLDLDAEPEPTPSQRGGHSSFDMPPTAPAPFDVDPVSLTPPAPPPAFERSNDMDFDLPLDLPSEEPARPQAPSPSSAPMDFDLSSISLDLDTPPTPAPAPTTSLPSTDFGSIDLDDTAGDDSDPINRKLELAEEFRQIGDMEGARDLLQEVIAKSGGATRARAQAMLDSLG